MLTFHFSNKTAAEYHLRKQSNSKYSTILNICKKNKRSVEDFVLFTVSHYTWITIYKVKLNQKGKGTTHQSS